MSSSLGKAISVVGIVMIAVAILLLGMDLVLKIKVNSSSDSLGNRMYNGTAVHDMNLNLIEARYGLNVTYIWDRTVSELPFTVRYYTFENGRYKLAFTTEENARYLVSVYGFGPSSAYGIISWPTYDRGWRYTTPFIPEDKYSSDAYVEPQKMYYVKLHDLQKVFDYMIESGQWGALDKCNVKRVLLGLDLLLYEKNVYISPDITVGTFPAAILLFLGSLICYIKQ